MLPILHTKSDFSLGSGTASAEDLVRQAANRGFSTLALTDVENLSAQVRFHAAAEALGVKPITGVELRAGYGQRSPGSRKGRLVLLARTRAGYQSLCRVVSLRRSRPGPTGPPLDCLGADPREVFYLSDDRGVLQDLRRNGVDPGDLGFLVADPSAPIPPGIRPVADPDVVMLQPEDYSLHVLLGAVRQGVIMAKASGLEPSGTSLPPDPSHWRQRFAARPDALEGASRLAESCDFRLLNLRPTFPCPEGRRGESPGETLDRTCRERLAGLGRDRDSVYQDRLDRELRVLRDLGFAGFLLIAGEITGYARSRGIAVGTRGSAAASLVAWTLGITQVDPIEYGLLFERFVHRHRPELPDIDLDLAANRREEVIEWVRKRLGEHRVAAICAHQTFGRKAAIREGTKALGRGDLIPRLIDHPRFTSVHPGGLVITDPEVVRYAPLELAPKGVPVVQYDMTSVSRLGLVKLDLLGNRALAAMDEAECWIRRRESPADSPAPEPATLKLLREGRTVGCFQIETPLMRSLLRRVPVRNPEDLMAALAIARPGPSAGDARQTFVRRARGDEEPRPPHRRLAAGLRRTWGMLLYEEDVIVALAELTGWSLGRADAFRSALLTAHPGSRQLAGLEDQFRRAAAGTGLSSSEAGGIWTSLAGFVRYAFNKAHAAGYARMAWRSASLKATHPVAFACGVLNHYGGGYPLRTVAADFQRNGVEILAPDVHRSAERHLVEDGGVRLGLASVRFLTAPNRRRIIAARPFTDFPDFLSRIAPSRREAEALVLSGACDRLPPLDRKGYPEVHEAALAGRLHFADRPNRSNPLLLTYARLVRIRNEIRFLGMHPSGHPMEVLREEAMRVGCVRLEEAPARIGHRIRVAGIVAASHRITTAAGRQMQFVTLEDESGLLEAAVRPDLLERLGDPVDSPGPFLIRGTVEGDPGDVWLDLQEVTPFHRREAPYAARAY